MDICFRTFFTKTAKFFPIFGNTNSELVKRYLPTKSVQWINFLSDPAIERINNSPIDKMIITDSILAREDVQNSSKIEQLSIAPLIGEAIGRITENKSVSSLFA